MSKPALTQTQIERIRENAPERSYTEWAKVFGVSYHSVYRAAKPVRRKYNQYQHGRKLTPEQVREIRINRYGKSFEELGKQFDMSGSCVRQVYHRETYRWVD